MPPPCAGRHGAGPGTVPSKQAGMLAPTVGRRAAPADCSRPTWSRAELSGATCVLAPFSRKAFNASRPIPGFKVRHHGRDNACPVTAAPKGFPTRQGRVAVISLSSATNTSARGSRWTKRGMQGARSASQVVAGAQRSFLLFGDGSGATYQRRPQCVPPSRPELADCAWATQQRNNSSLAQIIAATGPASRQVHVLAGGPARPNQATYFPHRRGR